ncbi:DUF2889 domain-containing protein [Myxococcota bacterium]|nr:DUF2889 domain-containing protein [Myxococcota bacterium]
MLSGISGEPLHTRCLAVAFSQGGGPSIEFRADILDLRKSGLMALAGRISSAGIIHKMELRGAFSAETGELERIEWDQSHVMHEANPSTRGECCRDPMARLKGLVGAPLGQGFGSALKQHFGGPLGCTHINTLFQELSAFAARFRTVLKNHPELARSRQPGERLARRSLFFDASLPEDIALTQLSVRLADVFFAARDEHGGEQLFSHDEVRVVTEAELKGWRLGRIEARERCRSGPSCGDQPWQSRNEEVSALGGQLLSGGVIRFCLERFGGRDEDARLLSALLCLAPAMTQVGAALSEALTTSASARMGGLANMGPGPCYMLRADGPLVATLVAGGLVGASGEKTDAQRSDPDRK